MRSDSSDRWQDDAGGMRRIKLRGNMKERCNVLSLEKYSPEKKDPGNITCLSTRVSEVISTMSQTVLGCAKIPKSAK